MRRFIPLSPWGWLVDFRLGRHGAGLEEVEVATFVRLGHVLQVERPEPARVMRLRWRPRLAALGELFVAHLERELPPRDVELDLVAVAHERERAADMRLRRDVEYARAVARAAH